MLIVNFLHSKEYWGLIKDGILVGADRVDFIEVQHKLLEEYRLKDLKVKIYLFHAIDHDILVTILNKDTTKDI